MFSCDGHVTFGDRTQNSFFNTIFPFRVSSYGGSRTASNLIFFGLSTHIYPIRFFAFPRNKVDFISPLQAVDEARTSCSFHSKQTFPPFAHFTRSLHRRTEIVEDRVKGLGFVRYLRSHWTVPPLWFTYIIAYFISLCKMVYYSNLTTNFCLKHRIYTFGTKYIFTKPNICDIMDLWCCKRAAVFPAALLYFVVIRSASRLQSLCYTRRIC